MEFKKIQNAELKNKKVLLRVDFNVGIENGKTKEKFKIESVRESVDYLLKNKAKIALVSHLGRPEGKDMSEFSLGQIKDAIEKILNCKIKFIPDCIGKEVKKGLEVLLPGEILLLENVRFYPGDEINDDDFSKKLAQNFDLYINDAFSVSHRDQASISGVAKILPSFAGFHLQKEISEMEKIKNNFDRPAVAIIGGAKIETKLPVIKFFEQTYDHVLVGGIIANEALDQKIKFSEKVKLPEDFTDNRLDMGPKTIEKYTGLIKTAKTIVWNGPTGKFEEEKYAVSTNAIMKAITESGAYSVVGGGETLEVLERNNVLDKINFVSTGGGAMLAYLAGKKMPGIEALKLHNT